MRAQWQNTSGLPMSTSLQPNPPLPADAAASAAEEAQPLRDRSSSPPRHRGSPSSRISSRQSGDLHTATRRPSPDTPKR